MNKLGIKVGDFIKAWGVSFKRKVEVYFKHALSDDFDANLVSRKGAFKYSIKETLAKPVVSNRDVSREVDLFIQENIDHACALLVEYETQLGREPETGDSCSIKGLVLDVAAGRIVLALGADSVAEENILRRSDKILSFYEAQLKSSPKGRRPARLNSLRETIISREKLRRDINGWI